MQTTETQYDVIILGAGIVGLVTANLCAKHNFKVALVDKQIPSTWNPNQVDVRCSAITRRTQNVLRSLGVWDSIVESRISPYQRMEVWDALSEGEINFDAREIEEVDLGHIVENSLMAQMLWEKLFHKENVDRFVPGIPLSFNRKSDHVILQLEDGTALTAQLLIGADGAKSWLRQALDIKTKGWDYQQNALVATITTEMPHKATARQCFLKDEILAFLPLSDPFLTTIVWSTSKEKSSSLLKLDENSFCKELAHAFDYRLGKILQVGERKHFPLAMQHAEKYSDDRMALVGDAAHVIHPLAGQGVNLGIYDAEALVEILKQAKQKREKGYDLGQALLLRRYERARKGHTLATMAAMEFFKRVFNQESSLLQGIRGLGIKAVNRSKFLKRKLIQQAMGIM